MPYEKGEPLVNKGKTVTKDNIGHLRIYASSKYLGRAQYKPHWLFEVANEITDELITGPPGWTLEDSHPTKEIGSSADAQDVFVVHGRNQAARDALFIFLRSIGLHPMEWSEVVQSTGKASPYIGEILDAAFSRAQAVVVLLTPDDEAMLKEVFWSETELPHETQLTGQARQNVLFEAGMAMGRNADQTVLVELGDLRPFSDVAGRHTIRLDDTSQRRQELAQRLEVAGCPVKLNGIDWHAAGNFEAALLPSPTKKETQDSIAPALEENRFFEMLDASKQIRERISHALSPSNPSIETFEAENIAIGLMALAAQMNTLGMNELNERLATGENGAEKLKKLSAMLGYLEVYILSRDFDGAKRKFASYNPNDDDR